MVLGVRVICHLWVQISTACLLITIGPVSVVGPFRVLWAGWVPGWDVLAEGSGRKRCWLPIAAIPQVVDG